MIGSRLDYDSCITQSKRPNSFSIQSRLPSLRAIGPSVYVSRNNYLKVLFLIIGLSDYNVILGRKQALYLEVLINYKNYSLKQLVYRPAKKYYSKVIAILKAVLLLAKRLSKLNKQYQRDIDYYNTIITLNSQRPRILKRDESSSNLAEPFVAPKIPPSILQPKVPVAVINII